MVNRDTVVWTVVCTPRPLLICDNFLQIQISGPFQPTLQKLHFGQCVGYLCKSYFAVFQHPVVLLGSHMWNKTSTRVHHSLKLWTDSVTKNYLQKMSAQLLPLLLGAHQWPAVKLDQLWTVKETLFSNEISHQCSWLHFLQFWTHGTNLPFVEWGDPGDPTQVQNAQGLMVSKTLQGLNQCINVKVGAMQKLQSLQVWQQLHEIAMHESCWLNWQSLQLRHFAQQPLWQRLDMCLHCASAPERNVLNLVRKLTHRKQSFVVEAPICVHLNTEPYLLVINKASETLVCCCEVEQWLWIKVSGNLNDDLSRHCEQLQR